MSSRSSRLTVWLLVTSLLTLVGLVGPLGTAPASATTMASCADKASSFKVRMYNVPPQLSVPLRCGTITYGLRHL